MTLELEEVVISVLGLLLVVSVVFNVILMVLNARVRDGVEDLRKREEFYKGQTYELRRRRDELFEMVIRSKTAEKLDSELLINEEYEEGSDEV